MALLGRSEWAGNIGTWCRWCRHVVRSGRWRAVHRRWPARLDGHFGKASARDDTLLAAVHLGAKCLIVMLAYGHRVRRRNV
jgi:hypothetical protein